jgi:hypothetical protein
MSGHKREPSEKDSSAERAWTVLRRWHVLTVSAHQRVCVYLTHDFRHPSQRLWQSSSAQPVDSNVDSFQFPVRSAVRFRDCALRGVPDSTPAHHVNAHATWCATKGLSLFGGSV